MSDTTPEITIILGTRPEIIKLSPVIRECENRDVPFSILHTGQHYSEELDSVFFDQLELPRPDVNLQVGSNSHGKQTGEMLAGIEAHLLDIDPNVVLVQGDTNSVLAGAIATSKLDIELGHVEAGLRSFDDRMPEETNRVVTDHVADYLFAPTEESARLLSKEGLEDSVYITGNTVVDAVHQNLKLATEKSDVLPELGVSRNEYALMTAHRAENVDDEETFTRLLIGAARVGERLGADVLYPIHPRAADKIERFSLTVPDSVRLIEPQDYLDFLVLEQNASVILTDSGGVQEEACILGVPCVTMRENTERPETVAIGANVLAGTDPEDIVEAAFGPSSNQTWENPFGDGDAASRIVDIVQPTTTTDPQIPVTNDD